MGDTSRPVVNVDNDHSLAFPPSLSAACEVAPHAFKERMALIEKTILKCGKGARFTARWVMENTRLWIFVDGDESILDPARLCDIRSDYGDCTLPRADYALLQRASPTTPAMRIAMIIWLVITSPDPDVDDSDVDDWERPHSDWDKWDIQGRAITLWADTFSEVMRSKKRPSDAIVTEPNALLAFQSAMERAGHQHDYKINPDVGAWVTMLAAFPELKREDLADVHFNDEDGCSLCAELLQRKFEAEAGYMPSDLPPLHLVAVWDYLCIRNPDPDSIIAFAAIRLPELFLPSNLRPVQEFFAKTYPERNRRIFCLHYQLVKNEPAVDKFMRKDVDYPSWEHLEDLIGSLGQLRPSGEEHDFSPTDLQPTLWFSIFRLLGQQYAYECRDFGSNPRQAASLLVVQELEDEVFGVLELPSLNPDLLPGHVQHAVERFCRTTECDTHTYKCQHTWRKLDMKTRRRYAAAYALLYSTDVVPLLSQDSVENCDACENIRRLYKCVDAISAGEIPLESNKIAKVVDFIERLAADDSESSGGDSDDQQHGASSEHEEIIHDETHEPVGNEMNNLGAATSTDPETEVSALVWEEDSGATQPHNDSAMGKGSLLPLNNSTGIPGIADGNSLRPTDQAQIPQHTIHQTSIRTMHAGWEAFPERPMLEPVHARVPAQEGEVSNSRWGPSGRNPMHVSFQDPIPNPSHVGRSEVVGSHVAASEMNWSTETCVDIGQPSELLAPRRAASPIRPDVTINTGTKASKSARRKDLHDFFISLFEKHDIPLGTTNKGAPLLPWKSMNQVLMKHGLEVSGWPEGVPAPGSYGKIDKGIFGFKVEHIGALYEAMNADRLDFRPLAGDSQQNSNIPRVRQREDDTEAEVYTRPAKKGKLAMTRKRPKAQLVMQSVWKFDT